MTGVIVLYDLHHKGNPWSVVLMAACRFLVYLVAGFGVAGGVGRAVVLLALIQFCYIALVSVVARLEGRWHNRFPYPLIPPLLAAICLVDGGFLCIALGSPAWILVGACGMLLTLAGQKWVRGD